MKKGIDVSEIQGTIDWEKVKPNVDFAIIRGGYGFHVDSQARRNLAECNRLNIPCGVYWFSYAFNAAEAKREAEMCLSLSSDFRLEYPIYFDFEQASIAWCEKNGIHPTGELVSNMCAAFCSQCEKAGYYSGVYADLNFVENYYTEYVLRQYDLWLAQWEVNSPAMYVNMWQKSEKGRVNGIAGYVDLDVDYIDLSSVIKSAGLNNLNICPTCGRPM